MTFINSTDLRYQASSVFKRLHREKCMVVLHHEKPVSIILEQQPLDSEALITEKYQAAVNDCNATHHLSLFVVKRRGVKKQA